MSRKRKEPAPQREDPVTYCKRCYKPEARSTPGVERPGYCYGHSFRSVNGQMYEVDPHRSDT